MSIRWSEDALKLKRTVKQQINFVSNGLGMINDNDITNYRQFRIIWTKRRNSPNWTKVLKSRLYLILWRVTNTRAWFKIGPEVLCRNRPGNFRGPAIHCQPCKYFAQLQWPSLTDFAGTVEYDVVSKLCDCNNGVWGGSDEGDQLHCGLYGSR